MAHITRPPTRRRPLGEAPGRILNSQQLTKLTYKTSPVAPNDPLRPDRLLQTNNTPDSPPSQGDHYAGRDFSRAGSPASTVANPRLSAISKEYPNSNRNSQISTVSTNASDGKRIKSFIGPWKLGKTLGKGATARVRLARHAYTGQQAAIKIVQKRNAQLTQAGSLHALDQAESTALDSDGMRRMPVGIEREVAIMKLIQHPNIMKLHDIWENRTEIYLVLEYIDNGELFDHITTQGRLEEEEAIKYFRQMLSAVGYCHSFNICHRDLKPENILLTKEGVIKIADFGMAALHQSPDHKLKTSCGSPHYAAPELIKGANYRGDKVDIWSMGVILYATLAGRLPFDAEGSGKEWLGQLLSKIKKGSFEMSPEFSQDATNLIWRILQVNPRDRITLEQIWRHPLLRKYDYLDDLGGGSYPQSLNVKDCGRPVLRRSDINKELLSHLRSMWHKLSEQQLIDALLCEEPNDQKLFYGLLMKYQDTQLENYNPDIGYSTSDYHHARPMALTKTYSTCHFPQTNTKGHGRQVSRFTVISNVAETEQSYDPFKASRPQHLDGWREEDRDRGARITIHRAQDNGNSSRQTSRASSRQRPFAPPRGYTSRSSMASSTKSRNSAVRPIVGYKRGVSFPHLRKRSGGSAKGRKNTQNNLPSALIGRHSNHTEVTDDGGDFLRAVTSTPTSTRYIRSRKVQATASQPLLSAKPGRASVLWNEDVRQLSTSLAKDCDEAFNRSSVVSVDEKAESSGKRSSIQSAKRHTPPLAKTRAQLINQKAKLDRLNSRPLPPPPTRSESINNELLEARKQAELRKISGGGGQSPRYLDRMVSHIDRLIQPGSPSRSIPERRYSSAPVETRHVTSGRPLPSIHEARGEDLSPRKARDFSKATKHQQQTNAKNNRIASAPEPRNLNKGSVEDRFRNPDSCFRDTIRVVTPSSPGSPIKAPAPLTIRKKISRGPPSGPPPVVTGGSAPDSISHSTRRQRSGLGLRQQYQAGPNMDDRPDLERIDEDYADNMFANESNSGTIVKKKTTWFRRNSKAGDDDYRMNRARNASSQSSSNDTAQTSHNRELPEPPKKRGFSIGRLFKKRNSKTDMTVAATDIFDDAASIQDSIVEAQRQSQSGRTEDPRARQIEPQQNWLAKLFNVKPASKFICFSVSKRRARQEITTVLKEWKRYGIRDVQIDKERNIVFGKVAAKNYLDMKEVAFAGEIMTVIEHGKRSYLSIARFTQERGAASSFHKVVETLETVLKCRGMLISDERKKRMMIKTLNAS